MYPCNCPDMKWIIDNYSVFQKQEGDWVLSWVEVDKERKDSTYLQRFGIKFDYCIFCGERIKG
jgi:hypothetical protein